MIDYWQHASVSTCQADNNLGHVARAELNVSVLHGPRVTLQRLQVCCQHCSTLHHLLKLISEQIRNAHLQLQSEHMPVILLSNYLKELKCKL